MYNRRYTIEGVQKLFKNRTLKDILGTEIQKYFFEDEVPEASDNAMFMTIKKAVANLSEVKSELLALAEN